MSLLKDLPLNMYVVKYKNGQYLGVSFYQRSKVLAFTKLEHADITRNRILKLKQSQIFYNPIRPSEFVLSNYKKNKDVQIHDLEVSKESRDVFINYIINKNMSIHVIDRIQPMKNSNLRMLSALQIEPALDDSDRINYLNEQFFE